MTPSFALKIVKALELVMSNNTTLALERRVDVRTVRIPLTVLNPFPFSPLITAEHVEASLCHQARWVVLSHGVLSCWYDHESTGGGMYLNTSQPRC